MNFSSMTKDEMIRYSQHRLRRNAKARATMTVDHACGCGGHGAPVARPTADAAAATSSAFLDAMNAATAAAGARMATACEGRKGRTVVEAPAASLPAGFTVDSRLGTPGAVGPARYWTPATIATAAALTHGKRSAA